MLTMRCGHPQDLFAEDGTELARRVRVRVAHGELLAGFIGALDVFLLLWFVLPSPPVDGSKTLIELLNLGVFVLVLAAGGLLGVRWGERIFRPIAAWLETDRRPTAAERHATLHHPQRCAWISGTGWAAAALIFLLVNLPFGVAFACHVASTIVLGGLTCVALSYLLTERTMRPVTARALSYGPAAPIRPGVKGRLALTWACATGVPLLGLFMLGVLMITDPVETTVRELSWSIVAITAVALMVGLAGTLLVSKSVAEPLAAMRGALARIEEGDLGARVRVDDATEVGLMQSRFNAMAAGLEERERLRDLFGRHVGEDVARAALDGDGLQLGGEVRDVGVLFVDLVGSTTLATECPPREVVALLNEFFAVVVEVVAAYGGWVNKFEGDAALAVFGAPVDHADPAGAALSAARALHERLAAMPLEAGIGVSAGPAVAGNVGAEQRFEYTVIGDPVNEAARLCELAKRHPDRVLASGSALERSANGEGGRWSCCDEVVLRGRRDPTRVAAPV